MKNGHAAGSEEEYKRMTETPIAKLVIAMAIPTILSQMITSIYNMADTYFVSSLGQAQTGAVGVVFALQSMIQAVGYGLSMGAGSLVSRKLGEKDTGSASKYTSSAFFAAMLLGAMLAGIFMIDLSGMLLFFGSTDTILPYAHDYAFIILLGAPIMCSSFVINNTLRAEGKAMASMLGPATGGILNIILDPIFINKLGLGIAGAAYATVLSQCIGFIILLWFYISGKSIVKLSPKHISRHISDYWLIFKTGLPTVFRQGLGSVSTALLNIQVKPYGDAAIAAISIANKIYLLLRSLIIGVGQGFQPVAGYNYGAGKKKRVRESFWVAVTVGTIISVVSSVFLLLFSERIIMIFNPETVETLEIGSRMLKYIGIAIPILGYSTFVNQLYQCLGFVRGATFLASCRQGICFIPLIFTLPLIFGLDGILVTQPASDIVTFIISIPFNIVFLKRVLDAPKEQQLQ